jgi:rhodanese-related sulfurtransferase
MSNIAASSTRPRYSTTRERDPAVTRDVLDTRPPNEYAAGHIAGAISVPIDDLQRRLRQLPKGNEYIAYCRGPYCVYADRAVEILRSNGRHARRLREGFPEWRAAGLPVEMNAGSGA